MAVSRVKRVEAALGANVRCLTRVEPTMRVLHKNVLDKEHDHGRNEE